MNKTRPVYRTCIATREKLLKTDLFRIVRNKDGLVFVDDEKGKANGRGVYLKKDKDVILGDNWRTNREDEHFKKLFEENKINLFTYELGTSIGYNSSYKVTCFYNNPRYHSKWHIKLESWRISSDVFNKLFGELEYDFDDLDALKNTLISLFKKDNQIYEKLKEFIQ